MQPLSWVKCAIFLLLCLGGLQFGVQPARAFEPINDYWFLETLSVSQVALPEGVLVRASESTPTFEASLTVENHTDTPLYILSLSYKSVLVMTTPDPLWKSRVNAAQEVASYHVTSDQPRILDMSALADLDQQLVDRNVLTYDPPPPDLTAPEAENSELLLVYDSQVIEVPFTLTYTLNTGFDNGSRTYWTIMTSIQATTDASATATQQVVVTASTARTNTILLSLAGLALLILLAWLGWRGFTRHS